MFQNKEDAVSYHEFMNEVNNSLLKVNALNENMHVFAKKLDKTIAKNPIAVQEERFQKIDKKVSSVLEKIEKISSPSIRTSIKKLTDRVIDIEMDVTNIHDSIFDGGLFKRIEILEEERAKRFSNRVKKLIFKVKKRFKL